MLQTQTNPKTIRILEQKIAAYRRRLQNLYNATGHTDAEVLAVSIELDDLLNEYQKLTMISPILRIP